MKWLPAKQIKAWLGYTRRERRASFILAILIVIIGGARYSVPESDFNIEIIPDDTLKSDYPDVYSNVANLSVVDQGTPNRKTPSRPVIDLNICDSTTLESLPGIGSVLAARIIKYRNLLGGFAYKEQLKDVYGLKPEVYEIIKDRVNADSTDIKGIDINSADYKQLIRFPYFDKNEVNAILKYRELEGRINKVSDLFENKLVAADKKKRISAYLRISE